MRIKTIPEDFIVEERIWLPAAAHGPYTLYQVRKRGATTLAVQAQIAQRLGVPHSAVSFPALKDKQAVAVQYAAIRGGGPVRLEGPGFVAERVGWANRPLAPSDLEGNFFTVVVRDLAPGEAAEIGDRLKELAVEGLPNYFDQQRFGSQTPSGEFPGRRILRRDAEGALHAYLAEPLVGDSPQVRAFKRLAAERWGEWGTLLAAAPRPSNYRSVLTFLKDHPADFRRALNLVTPRVLSLYLAAYQSLLWNRIVARYLTGLMGKPDGFVGIAGERLPLFRELAVRLPEGAAVSLPHHRARYGDPGLAAAVTEVLGEEGMGLPDLKPRILRRAYLPRGKRRLVLRPEEVDVSAPVPDERFPGRQKVQMRFALPAGSYGTLVLRAALQMPP